MKKLTKIVATIGPASWDEENIEELIKNGVNVFRQNFSHGNAEVHLETMSRIKKVATEIKQPVAILQDLAGPKMRTGNFKDDTVSLIEGNEFILTSRKVEGDSSVVSINYPELVSQVSPGDQLRLDDGKISLEVLRTSETDIHTKIINGGDIKSRRGINVPGVRLQIHVFTEQDKKNVLYFVDNQYDWISLSFVQSAHDIELLKTTLADNHISSQVMAKIETSAALENIEEIIAVSDGIMVARGDLAIETPVSQVPIWQKKIVKKCRAAGKPVIVATQMLETMMENPVPTRAEVSDIANAIFDGADAVMLSGETAAGNYPVKSVEAMADVCMKVEVSDEYRNKFYASYTMHQSQNSSIANSVFTLAQDNNVSAIVCLTHTGSTAKSISKLRPGVPIYALTESSSVWSDLQLHSSIKPILVNDIGQDSSNIRDWIVAYLSNEEIFNNNESVLATYSQAGFGKGHTDSISLIKI